MPRARNKRCPDCGKMILSNSMRCRSCATRKQFLGIKKHNTENMKWPRTAAHGAIISAALKGKKKSPQHIEHLRKSLTALGYWKKIGDTFIHKGYRCIKTREGNGSSNFVLEHRHIMEKYIGRPLNPDEHIHHKNFDKLDNRIENLEIVTRRIHQTAHKQSKEARMKISEAKKAYWKKIHEISSSSGLTKLYPARLRQI